MNQRLEAFCDAVFAIALTLLIIEIRAPEGSASTTASVVWAELRHLGPSAFAFSLSFVVILITWINHHNLLTLVHRGSPVFLYANGLLLLGVICIPFTTALLGNLIATNAAAPAVALYDAVLAVQSAGWVAVTGTALRHELWRDERGAAVIRQRRRHAYGAVGLYGALTLLALWLPRTAAVITTATWLFWLLLSLRSPRTNA